MNKDIHRMILESMLAILYNCYVIVLQYIFFKRTLMRGTRQLASSLPPPTPLVKSSHCEDEKGPGRHHCPTPHSRRRQKQAGPLLYFHPTTQPVNGLRFKGMESQQEQGSESHRWVGKRVGTEMPSCCPTPVYVCFD